jgi:hypothetical protein
MPKKTTVTDLVDLAARINALSLAEQLEAASQLVDEAPDVVEIIVRNVSIVLEARRLLTVKEMSEQHADSSERAGSREGLQQG